MKLTKNAKTTKAITLTSRNVGMVWPKISMGADLRPPVPSRKARLALGILEGEK